MRIKLESIKIYIYTHTPAVKLTKYETEAYITGIKVFNHLSQSIKILAKKEKIFKSTLKRFLYHYSYYSINEYFKHAQS
jgi:hypothetical protein